MNIKIAAYAIMAVLMGFIIMRLPLALKTEVQQDFTNTYQDGKGTDEQRNALPALYGLAQPSNLLPSSLILLTGLAAAISVYIILKKQLS